MPPATPKVKRITAQYLQSHALFGGVATADVESIMPLLRELSFQAGDYVVREGEQGNAMFFIREGSAEVLKRAEESNEELRLATLEEGDTFGEMELVDVQSRSASVRALSELHVLELTNEDLYDIFKGNQAAFIIILMNIAREISRRLRSMDALVASCLYRQGRPRFDSN